MPKRDFGNYSRRSDNPSYDGRCGQIEKIRSLNSRANAPALFNFGICSSKTFAHYGKNFRTEDECVPVNLANDAIQTR